MSEREKCIENATWAEAAERYEDMAMSMYQCVKNSSDPLSGKERNLLSVAYKNVIGAKRSSYRVLSSQKSEEGKEGLRSDYLKTIKSELDSVCDEVLGLLEVLVKRVQDDDAEAKVFYLKMKGDYLRYQAEVASASQADSVKELTDGSDEAYSAASMAAKDLPATHPIRLGLALNYSVFFYEIQNNPSKACELAKKAFDEAISDLDELKEDSYKDSTLIMQLLRDNLTLWTADQKEEQEDS